MENYHHKIQRLVHHHRRQQAIQIPIQIIIIHHRIKYQIMIPQDEGEQDVKNVNHVYVPTVVIVIFVKI